MSKGDKAKAYLKTKLLAQFGVNRVKTEYKGIQGRQFKFDYAVPDLRLAVEYEGLFSKKSRHTTPTGYSGDCTKYNLAALQGWTVLRYTAVNYQEFDVHLYVFCRDNIVNSK